jgi:general secretion pathway protein D
MRTVWISLFLLTLLLPVDAIDIAEKRARLEQSQGRPGVSKGAAAQANALIAEKKKALNAYYQVVLNEYHALCLENKDPKVIETIGSERLKELNRYKAEIKQLEQEWKVTAQNAVSQEVEGLWNQPDVTIGQLVLDYGSSEHIYLMPPEIASLKVHVSSQLSVPKASWSEMLDLILANYGIGIKELNTFIRQLYFLRLSQSPLSTITDDRKELQLMQPDARVCFVLQPPATELRRIYTFIEKFSPQEQMSVMVLSNSIVIVGQVREILELLKVYDFVAQPKQMQEYRLVALQKGQADEIAKILQSIFEGDGMRYIGGEGSEGSSKLSSVMGAADGSSGFRVIGLKEPTQSLFLLGKHDQIEKACQIIEDVENRIGEVQDKTVYWYACKHSEAEELAIVLSQVYAKMVNTPQAFGGKDGKRRTTIREEKVINDREGNTSPLVVNSPRISANSDQKANKRALERDENFIVDPKTNSIVMVVEAPILVKLKDLVKKLDVPKKMVQIDVLLFEKRVADNNTFGLNLLRMGQAASDKHVRSAIWNQSASKRSKKKHKDSEHGGESKGLLQFLVSRHKNGSIPAYDLAYNFLLAQEDIQINANPTITCVNQTTAKIAVVDQISINTGVVEIDSTKTTRLKDSFSREEYGIIIQLTPTIHAKIDDEEDDDSQKFIHLATDVIFDTTKPSHDNRPDVTRRNIKNEVRVADGETVILGGLRRKIASDNKEMIPFLGELPGVGRLFSISSMADNNTEMFIFITPRIVPDNRDDFIKMRRQAILTRPGDIPEFLQELREAQDNEKHSLFEQSMKMLLGRGSQNPVATSRQP